MRTDAARVGLLVLLLTSVGAIPAGADYQRIADPTGATGAGGGVVIGTSGADNRPHELGFCNHSGQVPFSYGYVYGDPNNHWSPTVAAPTAPTVSGPAVDPPGAPTVDAPPPDPGTAPSAAIADPDPGTPPDVQTYDPDLGTPPTVTPPDPQNPGPPAVTPGTLPSEEPPTLTPGTPPSEALPAVDPGTPPTVTQPTVTPGKPAVLTAPTVSNLPAAPPTPGPADIQNTAKPYGGGTDNGCSGDPPTVTTADAGSVQAHSAQLSGTVKPNGMASNYWWEYGPTTAYGSQTGTGATGDGHGVQSVTRPIGGLLPGQTYHFRLVANSAAGRSSGPDKTFTTASA